MNIVPLAEVDGFIRKALTEVRKGVATARNNNQANPLNGIMVDLPEKIDFEMMVITAYQSLNKSSTTSEASGTSDRASSVSLDFELSKTLGTSRNFDISEESSSTLRKSDEAEQDSSQESSQEIGSESDRDGSLSGSQSQESQREAQQESEQSKDQEERDEKGQSGESEKSESKSTQNEQSQRATNETSSGADNSNGRNGARQGGQVFEQNTRFSRTFDQDTGRWGAQAFSTPNQPCRLKCS